MSTSFFFFFFFNDTATTEIYTLSLHDALPIYFSPGTDPATARLDAIPLITYCLFSRMRIQKISLATRSEEHTSELQSRLHLVCRLLLEKKKNKQTQF